MMNSSNTFCCELSKAVKTILDSMVETSRFEQISEYALLFSKAILFTKRQSDNSITNVEFVLYHSPTVTIVINILYGGIIGYANNTQTIELPLDESLIDYLNYTVCSYEVFLHKEKELQTIWENDEFYTIDLLA